jgi:hypothetical protein
MRAYQYLIIFNPNEAAKKAGEKASIIKDVTTILAKDEKEAGMKATRAIPTNLDERLDEVEVIVRPF